MTLSYFCAFILFPERKAAKKGNREKEMHSLRWLGPGASTLEAPNPQALFDELNGGGVDALPLNPARPADDRVQVSKINRPPWPIQNRVFSRLKYTETAKSGKANEIWQPWRKVNLTILESSKCSLNNWRRGFKEQLVKQDWQWALLGGCSYSWGRNRTSEKRGGNKNLKGRKIWHSFLLLGHELLPGSPA